MRFRREVDENYALLGYYAASSGNSLQWLRNNPEERGSHFSYRSFHSFNKHTQSHNQFQIAILPANVNTL
jgi:hypothetical protein